MIDKLTENDTDAEVATLGPRPSKGDALKRNLRIGSQPSIDQLAHDASADADQTGSRISAAVRPPTEIPGMRGQ